MARLISGSRSTASFFTSTFCPITVEEKIENTIATPMIETRIHETIFFRLNSFIIDFQDYVGRAKLPTADRTPALDLLTINSQKPKRFASAILLI
jgi:hypothetical protein